MRRLDRALRTCAVWLWLALAWACVDVGAVQAAGDVVLPRVLADAPQVPLSERSLYWIDESGSMGPGQVEAAVQDLPWRLRKRENQRANEGTLWIMFEASVPVGQPWFLEVAAAVNDRLQLFHRDAAGNWVVQQAGTGLPVVHWPVPGRLPTFKLSTQQGQPVRYLLRVDDRHGDFVAPLSLLRQDALQVQREREQYVLGAYFGVLAMVAFAALANGLAFRDRAAAVFGLCIVVLGLGQLAGSGLGGQHLWPEWSAWNDALLELWPGASVAMGLWLLKILTDPARLSRVLDLWVWALIAALLGATAVHLAVDNSASRTLVLSLTGLALIAVLSLVLWGGLGGKEPHRKWVAAAFVPIVLLAAFPLARDLGFVPASVLTRFGLYFGTLLGLPILYHAVSLRLMARREAELRASTLQRADPLTGLPHRQAMVERLASSLTHARSQRQSCALLCIRIANLEAIGENFGREAVDKALVVTASHLRRLSVGYDMTARVGPREFALLLEAPATRDAAISRAQQLVASGLREVPALPGATLRFHVTEALLPLPHLDGAATLQWVVDGLDQITADTRKAIRSLDSAVGESVFR